MKQPRLGNGQSGQAASEMIILLPLLLILGGIAISVAYMCWQGIKVQEAANYAARLEGQERVAGGTTDHSIEIANGGGPGEGDSDVTAASSDPNDPTVTATRHDPSRRQSVYGQYYERVRAMFGKGENDHLFIPPAKQGTEIDQVKVIRVMTAPTFFGIKIPQVVVTGTAYGGEDPNMYALPRFGCTGPGNENCEQKQQYWNQPGVLKPGSNTSATPL